jgi:hypothetical protein
VPELAAPFARDCLYPRYEGVVLVEYLLPFIRRSRFQVAGQGDQIFEFVGPIVVEARSARADTN